MLLRKIAAVATAVVMATAGSTLLPTEYGNFSRISITASAASDFIIKTDYDGYKYVSDYKGDGGNIRIPDEVDYIGEAAFRGNSKIKSVTIPASCDVTHTAAFAYCANLKKVVFEGNAAILMQSFYACPSLESVTVKGSIWDGIYLRAFADCTSLKTIKIYGNDSEFLIAGNSFANCYSLTSINIPSKCTEIYPGAFINCFSLTNLTIPANTKINEEGEYYNSYHFGMYSMVINGLSDKTAARLTYPDLDDYEFVYGVADGKTSGYVNVCCAKGSGTEIENDIMMDIRKFTPEVITLTVTKGSEAEKWAKKNKVKYEYSKLAAPTDFKASKCQTKITLSWDAVEGADGYVVYMYNEKTGKYESYKSVKNAKCTISGLKKNTKYKFKVAALVKKDGKYVVQTSSKAVSATTKK